MQSFLGTEGPSELASRARLMFPQPPINVGGVTGVIPAVIALENIDKMFHARKKFRTARVGLSRVESFKI